MDRVRFGRALGIGTRLAVKTLATAVDAATAEDPSAKRGGANTGQGAPPQPGGTGTAGAATWSAARSTSQSARTVAQARDVKKGLERGGRRFGEAFWGRAARLSGVLWLEVSGTFFGIFALGALSAVVRLRGDWRLTGANSAGHRNLIVAAIMTALFGYFCVSNFVRARRRERGH